MEPLVDIPTPSLVTAAAWCLLALFHTGLGERLVLRPLFESPEWDLGRMSRQRAEILLRFAWHVTSVTWLALAAITIGVPIYLPIFVVAMAAAIPLLIALRGHPAWPIFLLAAIGAAWPSGWLEPALRPLALSAVVVLALLGVLHVAWAAGLKLGLSGAVPSSRNGKALFRPGPLLTLAVAASLFAFSALLILVLFSELLLARILVGLGVLVLVVRAIGDGRYVGFFKQVRDTQFGQLDDRLFTPIVVFLVFGSLGALLA